MTKKIQQKTGELVFGIHPIIELLKAKKRKIITIYTTKPTPQAWSQIEPFLPKYPIQMQYVTRDVLHKVAGTTDHQSVIAFAHPFPYRKKFFDAKKESFLVMLDGLQDPRNVGAIIRSAYCTGVSGVIMIKKGAAPLTAAAIKASAGLSEHMEIYLASSAKQAAQELADAGYTLYLATFAGKEATACAYQQPLCLVIGGEGFGISKDIIRMGTAVTIAQRSPDISYNASVAAGILLFLIGKKTGTM
jgi:23S rRNA (guanosine2251-2'-O)-methyltransferase